MQGVDRLTTIENIRNFAIFSDTPTRDAV